MSSGLEQDLIKKASLENGTIGCEAKSFCRILLREKLVDLQRSTDFFLNKH